MTREEIIRNCENLLDGNNQDPLYQTMLMMMNMLMEVEATKITGSEKGEHNSNRTDYRSGTKERRFDTRLGTFNIQIPKFRNTGYVPFFMQNKQRSEEALISMSVMIVKAIDMGGKPGIIAVEAMENESEATYKSFSTS